MLTPFLLSNCMMFYFYGYNISKKSNDRKNKATPCA